MRVKDGNIFEVLRLILPEHRTAMERLTRETVTQHRPVLSDDLLEEMQSTLRAALLSRAIVSVKVFNRFANKVLKGRPIVKDNKLCVVDGDSKHYIDLKDVLSIDIV